LRILGIDTSSKALSIALSKDRCIDIEESHLLDRRHSSLLVPKIKEMLEKANLSIDEVDVFVIGLGPGSFTGLRIGVSTVKGFGIAMKKPCIGIPSIDALAMNADVDAGAVVPIIDAKRENVYSAVYRKKKGRLVRKTGHLLLNVDKLMKRMRGPAVFLGDGVPLYRERIQRLNKKAVFLEEQYWYPAAGNLIRLALEKLKAHKRTGLEKLKPIYLYPRDCQVK